jgi:hypothetical protein
MVGTSHGKNTSVGRVSTYLIPAQRLLKPLFLGYEDLRHCSGYLSIWEIFFQKIYKT